MLRPGQKPKVNPFTAAGVVPRSERSKVVPLEAERLERGRRVERENLGGGKVLFTLVFPTPKQRNPEQRIPLQHWLDFPRLAEPFAAALLEVGVHQGAKTRDHAAKQLDYFARFLQETTQKDQCPGSPSRTSPSRRLVPSPTG